MTEEIGSSPEKPVPMNYAGNSEKLRQEAAGTSDREPVKRIVDGKIIERKKSLGRKISETFKGDDAKSIGQFILFDVVIPKTKDIISDAANEFIQRSLYGGNANRPVASNGNNRGRNTAYNRIYVSPNASPSSEDRYGSGRQVSAQARATHNFRDIILGDRGQAEEVLDGLLSVIDQYGTVSVADFYEMVGTTGEFTDQKWGWKDLGSARVDRVREGYLLALPKTISLD